MWIVRLALSRPYTFIVMALVIILLTFVVVPRTPTDIFPVINIPVIALDWTYDGLQPQEMEQRITSPWNAGITTLVNDVEHIESQSLNGIAVIKIYFQPKRQYPDGAGANYSDFADFFAELPARDDSATGDHLFRIHGSGPADRADQRPPERAGSCSTTATILSERNWRPCRAQRCLIHMAENRD